MNGQLNFDFATAFQAISVVFVVITLAVTVTVAYVSYVSIRLPKRIDEMINERLKKGSDALAVRLQIVGLMSEALNGIAQGNASARQMLYLLSHVMRLGSGDDSQVELSIRALEGFGSDAAPVLALAERVRTASSWSVENQRRFDTVISKLTGSGSASHENGINSAVPNSSA